ncbi:hypothetical protein GSI_01458 [Ganoderma sinense ZZ0214-1]|uniref:Uncharacterized protein n=1 Tax=Ganoderma sinense ZZ0214-1 TaxID=1077348 RepID=A0A2G8SVH6_9APHY|nr:hypothetical protein GSI_01458 [Ganoderma sinense ZZ0214-1]
MSSTGWPNNLTFVDDFDSRIQYSAGWQVVTGGAEVEGTKHGADKAGMTATFSFSGTFVSVVGSLGSVDVYGIPTMTYAIDGSLVDTYTAPVLAPGTFRLNQTFFNSPTLDPGSHTLDPGSHTLVITNVNGTSPNVVWLDYILFAESTPSAPSSTTTIVSSSSASLQTSASAPVQGPHKSNVGAIVGGIVGGVAGLALLAAVQRTGANRDSDSTPPDPPAGPDSELVWRDGAEYGPWKRAAVVETTRLRLSTL